MTLSATEHTLLPDGLTRPISWISPPTDTDSA